MAKKKILEETILHIKKSIEEDKAIFGTEEVKAALLNNELKEVFISANCPVEDEIRSLTDINDVVVTKLKQANDELGVVCKKHFSISVMAIKNE